MTDNKRIAIVGAGFMGTVIAVVYARHGYDVVLHDTFAEALDGFAGRALPIARSLSEADAEDIVARVATEADFDKAVAGAAMVHEIVQEKLDIKQEVFERLDRTCPPEVILATNTSSFLITELCERVTHKERVIGIHYFAPAHIMPVVEIITASFTPESTIEWAKAFAESIEKAGVLCKENPGFLVNRLQLAMLAEAHRLVAEKVATPEDIDTAFRLALAPRLALWGPLLTEDLSVNKNTAIFVFEYLAQALGAENFAPTPKLREMAETGRIGAMGGKGWYDWEAPFDQIVQERDGRILKILDWLKDNSGMSSARPWDGD